MSNRPEHYERLAEMSRARADHKAVERLQNLEDQMSWAYDIITQLRKRIEFLEKKLNERYN